MNQLNAYVFCKFKKILKDIHVSLSIYYFYFLVRFMSNKDPLVSQLFTVLRRKLKAKSLTYRDIAYALNATDVSVKRWFSEERLSVSQLSRVANLLGLSLTELVQEAEAPPLQQLTLEQEAELVRDIRLFLVTRCVLNKLTLAEIVKHYNLTEVECIQYLLRLDRLRII